MDSTTGTPPPPSEEQQQPTSSRRRGGGQKRKMTSVNSGNNSSSKRQGRERPPPVPFPQIYTNGPLTRARLNPTSSSSNNNYQVEVVAPVAKSEVEVQEAAKKAAEEMDRAIQDWEALEAKIDNEFLQVKMTAGTVHVVPVHAGWFLWKEIHPLEKKMMPSFFNEKSDKRNPEMYMEIRNWIMKKFHLDPSVNIELKHLSELTVGELDAKQEVMEFLDYWGLINYHPFPENEPVSMNVDTDADEALKPDSLVEKLFKFEAVQSWSPVIPRMSTAMPARPSGLVPESSVVVEELVKSEGPSVEYHCNSCSADCSRKRYHCQKQADFDLCAECFNNGKFGSNMSPSDFILMEPPEAGGASGGNWTDQETILLLEAIELFRDNWSEIAEHVATKTKAQCILHFVQMPIEDTFFNDSENKATPEENGLPVSTNTEHSSTIVDQDKDVPVDDVSEQKKSANDNQMEVSKVDDLSESDNIHEVNDSVALKALKEAFESVGALPSSDGKLSFAEVGNPVMALAAFLVRLVEPNIATASVRTLLKSLASNHSGSHLAARHCFCLEDPPNEEKKLDNLEGALIEENGPEVEEHVEKHDEQVQKENGDPCDSVIDRSSAKHDCNDKNKESASEEHEEKKDSPSEDQKAIVSNTGFSEKTNKITADGAQPTSMNVPSSSDIPKEGTSKNAEESAVLESNSELQSDIMKEDGDLTEDHSQVKKPLKDEEMLSNSEEKEADALVVSNSATEKEKDTGHAKHESVNEKKEAPANNDDVDSNKLQKVAMTALSAAAVKARLLADHEEDQIRQLATFLIDKQLHKLEAKLSFFNDMETVASRVKEQLDRSKQRLFQERAQIIASRFGMSASARPNSQTVPTLNRASLAAMPNPNQGPRPFMGMNSMRPPISRPVMAPNLPSSNFVPATASGTLNQPSQ